MNQDVTDQRIFPFLDEVEPPEMMPIDKVAQLDDEVQAINYSLDHIMRKRRGLTQMQLADEMKITRAVMTKIKQGQASVPVGKFITFIETTRSFALIQYYAMRLGLVIRTREAETKLQRELAQLREENQTLKERYRRVVGGD